MAGLDVNDIQPMLTNVGLSSIMLKRLLGSSSQAYMTRSKTNVTSGQSKPGGIGGRSLTAQQPKKENRQPITATTSKPAHVSHKADITIPISARDPDEPDEMTPAVSKSTPSAHKNIIEEENDDIVLEEWPDVEETTDLSLGNEGKNATSRLSGSRSVSSPMKAPTPNPLKAVELVKTMSEDEQARLKQTFNKLDTDKDGHIMFSQLQTQLPKQFSQAQEKYIKQVYDITSSNTFFGVDEFMTMSYLTSVVTGLSGEPRDAYNKLEFHGLHDVILQYVELFQTVDRSHRGKIALTSLQDILQTALSIDFKTEPPIWNKILDTIDNNEPMTITKIEFLAHIPYFQTLGKKK
ncbi:hypothetical protein ACF0H5_007307 [Mactra antiquata]